jgi:hypothetical protein
MSMRRASCLLIVGLLVSGCSRSGDVLRPPTRAAIAFIGVSPGAMLLTIGQTRQMTAVLRDADGNLLTGRTVVWSIDAPTVASISAAGQLVAVGHGYVTITATSEGKSSSVAATIVQPE